MAGQPTVLTRPTETFQGFTVADMPGDDTTSKAMTFALIKRGKLPLAYITATPRERARMNGRGSLKRRHDRKASLNAVFGEGDNP